MVPDPLTPRQEIVLVSGAPGSGKTMVAVPLAAPRARLVTVDTTAGVDLDAIADRVAALLS